MRELALEYGVNPNTVQKALSELERDGFLFSERTSGRRATGDTSLLQRLKTEQTEALMASFAGEAEALGIPRGELSARLAAYLEGIPQPANTTPKGGNA